MIWRLYNIVWVFNFRYNNIVLLDATYKTSRLNLPLFFLVVKTNVGYSPVASFITQSEDSASIAEALQRIKAVLDKDDIKISAFMIDKSAAEKKAIGIAFPG